VQHLGGLDFHRGDVRARRILVALVDVPGGIQDEEPELLQLDERVRDRLLRELLLGERAALRAAAEHALAHHPERFPDGRDGPHRMMDPSAAEASLRDQKSLAFATEEVLARNAHAVVAEVGVVAVPERLVTEPREPDDLQARRVARDEEHRRALVNRNVGIRDYHRDQELGEVGVRREVLLAGDDPPVAVADRAAAELPRIGTALRLGH